MGPLGALLCLLLGLAAGGGPPRGAGTWALLEDASLALLGAALPGDLEPECQELLAGFATSCAALSGCLVRSARPVRLCQSCYGLFRAVTEQLDNITRAVGVRAGRGAAGRAS